MKPKKQKKQPKKIVKKSPKIDLASIMYVFFLSISLTYGVLLWGIGRSMNSPAETLPIAVPSPLENKIKTMVTGFPIDRMTPYISRQDEKTAAFLIGVAKKESNWGIYSPKDGEKECFNYWGYRGSYKATQSGYSCFDSPRQAVAVVGNRINELIAQDIDTPEEMVVWKCGRMESCLEASSAQKWIDDVDIYYSKFY